jgi:hypothetical protein
MSQTKKIKPLFDIADFEKYQWLDVLASANLKHLKQCEDYSKEFKERAKIYELNGDSLAQEIFNFLENITSNLMKPLGHGQSYTENFIDESISEQELFILRELVLQINDPEMKARVTDILWICKRDSEKTRPIKMAKEAVQAYLQSARILEDVKNEYDCCVRLKRSAYLASIIDGKKSTEMRVKILEYVNDLIDRHATVKDEFLTGRAMQVLQEELGKSLPILLLPDFSDNVVKYANIAAKKALYAENFPNYHTAFYHKRSYRQIESEWYKIAKNQEARRNAEIEIAEAEVWYAQKAFVGNEQNAYGVAAGRIRTAILAFKKIEDTFKTREDTSKRLQELHQQMLYYQKQSMSKMVTIPIAESNDFHDPNMQQSARKLVQGKSLYDALHSLAFGCKQLIRSIEELKTEAKKQIESYQITHLIPASLVDEEGKTKAITKNDENDLKNTMLKIAESYHGWYGLNFIAPACTQICTEHNLTLDNFSFIVDDNPFIPKGREPLYAKGLMAGLQGDPIIASHLLIPQLENSLRYILKQNDIVTSRREIIQDEFLLHEILNLPELKEVLAEDLIFTLKGLLIERWGSNLRNDICHGLLDHNHFFDSVLAYLWWLTLYMCLGSKL